MRLVIAGRVKLPLVNRFGGKFTVYLYERSGVGIADPSIKFPCLLFQKELKTIRLAKSTDDVGLYLLIQDKLSTTFKIKQIINGFVVPLDRTFYQYSLGLYKNFKNNTIEGFVVPLDRTFYRIVFEVFIQSQ